MESLEQLSQRLRQLDELSQQTHPSLVTKENNHKNSPTTALNDSERQQLVSKQFGLSSERRLNNNAALQNHRPTRIVNKKTVEYRVNLSFNLEVKFYQLFSTDTPYFQTFPPTFP